MKKLVTATTLALFMFCFSPAQAAELSVGFVNFQTCLEKSKLGQQEESNFESMKKQMSDSLEIAHKELEQIAKNLQDKEYMEGLSPTAENELKQKCAILNEEIGRYQNQYYQLLNQAKFKMVQNLHDEVCLASQKIREAKKLSLILNEDSAFAVASSLDLTEDVVKEMNRRFDIENTGATAR